MMLENLSQKGETVNGPTALKQRASHVGRPSERCHRHLLATTAHAIPTTPMIAGVSAALVSGDADVPLRLFGRL